MSQAADNQSDNTNASSIFPVVASTIAESPKLIQSLSGYFTFIVSKPQENASTYYALLNGQKQAPVFSTEPPIAAIKQRTPNLKSSSTFRKHKVRKLPACVIYISDKDLLAWVSGGLSTRRGIVGGRIQVLGEVELAFEVEKLWQAAGGGSRVREFMHERRSASETGSGSKL
ncbi:hypothetical protein BCR37DRAFT_376331 [Protomyces lactucae-debilis]|uniref:SCP2 domain-containing protein n=1 Tax=Protomyces lactucae-debilis TaxID=2754530 RepID=A0A1Y2FSN7_PROLT|nr:uncharacterized protein BCR37DRAFT_376331 [Protomyces lactucae-debilis]ORY86988.1 hypothetical protein BCR37DRAFT_376331 [Protomyces lactucae-debilis]